MHHAAAGNFRRKKGVFFCIDYGLYTRYIYDICYDLTNSG